MPETLHRALRRSGGVVLALVLAAGLSACAVLPKFETPRLSVVGIEIQSADLFSQRLKVRMRVQNPNSRELPVKGISFSLAVNDAELGQGLANAPFVVPALGEAEFDVQMTANVAGVLSKLLSRRKSEGLDYRLAGKVDLSRGLLRSIPFDERGTVKF